VFDRNARHILNKFKLAVVVNTKNVAIGGRRFPFAKTDEDDHRRSDGILSFLFAAEFVANMSDQANVVVGENFAHAMAEQFGDTRELLGGA